MSNIKQLLTLTAEPVFPENWCILEIHMHDGGMDVKFYRPYSSDDVIITAGTLEDAIHKFRAWLRETDNLIAAMGA